MPLLNLRAFPLTGSVSHARRRLPLLLVGLALALAPLACAGGGAGGERVRQNILTPEEIQESTGANLYEVVEQLRPRWLQVRGPTSLQQQSAAIGVFVNRTYQGGTETLRGMPKSGVARMQYLDGPQANAQLRSPGAAALAGAILVETGSGD